MSSNSTLGSPSSGLPPARAGQWTKGMVLTALLLALTLEAVSLGAMMISMALPSILEDFPSDQGGWLASAYYLSGAVAAPLVGKCADLYGKKRMLLVVVGISGIGTVICVLAPTLGVLILGRVFQGMILATLSLSYSLLRDIFPPKPAAFAASITITGMGFFGIVTPILVGLLLARFGWRGMFMFDVVWTFSMLVLLAIFVPESKLRKKARPDIIGGVLLASGVAGMLIYVSLGRSYGWASVFALSFLIGGAILFAAALMRSRRVEEPIINISLFKRRSILFAAVLGGVGYGLAATVSQIIPLLALTKRVDGESYGLGLTTVEYAQIETPKAIIAVLVGFLLGWLISRGRSPRKFLLLGIVLYGVAAVLLATLHDTQGTLTMGALLVGVAASMVTSSLPNVVIQASPAGEQASVAGTVQLVQSGLGAAAPIVMFTLMAPYIRESSTGGVVYGVEGFHLWLYGAAAAVAIIFLLSVTLLRPRPGEVQTVDEQVLTAAALAESAPVPAENAPALVRERD